MGFHLEVLNRISALIPDGAPCVTMFVTSLHWGRIAAEVKDILTYPTSPPTPDNFKSLRVGHNLLVVNSGSEDQDAVNLANCMEAERVGFRWRHDHLQKGVLK